MKKILLSSLLVFVTGTAIVVGYKHSKAFQRAKFEFSLKQEYSKLPHSSTKIEKETAADQPDMAALQDYFMTVDPSTGTIPRERLFQAYNETRSIMKKKNSGAPITWTGYSSNMGGRTRAIMYDPNDPSYHKVWAGGVTGGLWYNTNITDPNQSWVPVGDFWPMLAIRCITYDPNNPSIFYIGTGEPETAIQTYRESSGLGDGIWKSTDGGVTWNLLNSTTGFAYVPKIVVRNESGSSVIYAAVVSGLYHGTHTNLPSDGLFRSTDRGITWTQVLPNITGYSIPYSPSDVVLGADGRIFVGTMPNLNGTGAAVLLYSDTGLPGSWNVNTTYRDLILANPQYNIPGRVVFGCAPSDPNVVYALVASGLVSSVNNFKYFYCYNILRSADKGVTWTKKNLPTNLTSGTNFATIAWHALDIAVDPNDPNTVFIGGLDVHKTNSGGNYWNLVSDWSLMYYGGGSGYVHADQHIMVFKPGSSTEMLLGSDGGVFFTGNANVPGYAPVFEQRNLDYNTLQFYTADLKNEPGSTELVGGLQDNGCLYYYELPVTINDMVSGGDGAYCFFDKNDVFYSISSVYYNSYYVQINGVNTGYLLNWSSGVFINPADYDYRSKVLYANACDFIGNYLDYYLQLSDVTGSGYGEFKKVGTTTQVYFSAIKWSPFSPSGNANLFLGTQSGRLFKVTNAALTPVTTEITGSNFPVGNIASIDIGKSEDTLLVTFSNYGVASVFTTFDGGQNWVNCDGNLPDMPVRWGIFHPQNPRHVMLATETGVWATDSINASPVTWTPVVTGMANVRVDQLNIRTSDNTVVAASHGRGLFTTRWVILDAIANLQLQAFKMYPNPVRDMLNLSFEMNRTQNILFKVVDPSGKIVMEENKGNSNGRAMERMNVSGLATGVYFISIYGDGKKLRTEKFIKY
ncbi:MAG TPA: T9SS type A sorting domain-containing protein [Bacteroidales bacterium]|nr:T9SS type A sorting domain-containing protein [Bacteroidales bacterium]